MECSAKEEKKKAFVQGLQEQIGQIGERLYEWMVEEERTLTEMEAEVKGMMWQMGQGRGSKSRWMHLPARNSAERFTPSIRAWTPPRAGWYCAGA